MVDAAVIDAVRSHIVSHERGMGIEGRDFFNSLRLWGEAVFGPVSAKRITERANEEMIELLDKLAVTNEWNAGTLEEAADIVVILTRAPGLWEAILSKMKINVDRQWNLKGDGTGYHIPTGGIAIDTSDNTIQGLQEEAANYIKISKGGDIQTQNLHLKPNTVYKNRNGEKVLIMEVAVKDSSGEAISFQDTSGFTYRPNGQMHTEPETPSLRYDLVEELFECHGLDTPDKICFYENEYYVFSNFSSFQISAFDRVFATSEHLYHWRRFMLSDHPDASDVAELIYRASSAHVAFKLAQEFKYCQVENWDEIKPDEMEMVLRLKTDQHGYVRHKLIQSDGRRLVENSPRDSYWGEGPNGDGLNMLGELWMKIRPDYIHD